MKKLTSIDELALLNASAELNIKLSEKSINTIHINYYGNFKERWEILATLPFDSERKRMTIIVKSEEGNIMLFSKGAEEIMYPMISINLQGKIPKGTI
jgi:magnesium-transporting ATPase (P-type)